MTFTVVSTFLANNVSDRDVIDGLTNTIFIGEAPEALHGLWAGHKNFFDQSAPLNARLAGPGRTPWASCLTTVAASWGRLGCDFGQEYHSYHVGGAFFTLGDGSVRFVRDSINPGIWVAISTRTGGETVGDY